MLFNFHFVIYFNGTCRRDRLEDCVRSSPRKVFDHAVLLQKIFPDLSLSMHPHTADIGDITYSLIYFNILDFTPWQKFICCNWYSLVYMYACLMYLFAQLHFIAQGHTGSSGASHSDLMKLTYSTCFYRACCSRDYFCLHTGHCRASAYCFLIGIQQNFKRPAVVFARRCRCPRQGRWQNTWTGCVIYRDEDTKHPLEPWWICAPTYMGKYVMIDALKPENMTR